MDGLIKKRLLVSLLAAGLLLPGMGLNALGEVREGPLVREDRVLERAVDLARREGMSEVSVSLTEAEGPVSNEPVRVIVEFTSDPRGAFDGTSQSMARIDAERDSFFRAVETSGIDFRQLDSFSAVFNGVSALVRPADLDRLEAMSGVARVYRSREILRPEPLMEGSAPSVEAPYAWNLGYDGKGLTVAVIDSGFDTAHPDFRLSDPLGAELTPESLLGKGVRGRYISAKFPYAYNYFDASHVILESGESHGQHVAGIIAANSTVRGIAPESQLLGMRVFSNDPLITSTYEDIYIKAMDDAVKLGADVLNLSLGAPAGFSYEIETAIDQAVSHARDAGLIVAIAAGNDRNVVAGRGTTAASWMPDQGLVATPALVESSLAVAAADTKTSAAFPRMADFSTWGSTNDLRLKPEITAPGQYIRSTQNDGSFGYMSGTSMATPHVAGGAAVLAGYLEQTGRFDGMTPAEQSAFIKHLMMNSAEVLYLNSQAQSPRLQGAGMMDLENAIRTRTLLLDRADGDAKVELRMVPDPSLDLDLEVKNFGELALDYEMEVILLTDRIDSLGNYTETSRNVAFSLSGPQRIRVEAGQSLPLDLTLDFTQGSVPKEQFIEGFIRLTDQFGEVSTIPFMGFYGDWNKPLILDPFKPGADGTTDPAGPSYFKKAGLLGYASAQGTYYYHPADRIELNPGTAVSEITGKGSILPYLSFLRSAEKFHFNILDSSGELLRSIGSVYEVPKILRLYAQFPDVNRFTEGQWSGQLGSGLIPEGQYYYELKGQINDPQAVDQSKRIPMIIDYSAPLVTDIHLEGSQLSFQASDGDPLTTSGMHQLVISSSLQEHPDDITVEPEADGRYQIDVQSILALGSEELYIFSYDDLYNSAVYTVSTNLEEIPAENAFRIAGATRYATSVEISRQVFDASDWAIIVSGEAAVDSLLAGPLSVALDAPILLADPKGLTADVRTELGRLGVSKALIIGGELVVPQGIVTELNALGIAVERQGGGNRYETSMLIDARVRGISGAQGTAVVANGYSMFDALSMGAAAGRMGVGILLNDGKTAAMIGDALNGNAKVFLLGGTLVESDAVAAELRASGKTVERIFGSNRYATAVAIASRFYSYPETVIIASGITPYDALSGTALSAAHYAPMVLTATDGLHPATREYMITIGARQAYLLGGELRIPLHVEAEIRQVLN